MRPSVAPNTTTRSHSRPLTRWIVDSVTPPSARSRWNARRSHASNERGVGMEVGHLEQGLEVVEVRAARPAGAVEQRHGRAEADVVAHGGEEVARGRAAGGERGQPVEVDGEVVELLAPPWRRRCAAAAPAHVVDRAAAVEPLRGPLRQPAAGPAVHLAEVGAADVVGVDGDAHVGQRRPHAEARQHALVEDRVDRRRPPRPARRAGASSSDCTRVSTAISAGSAPGSASQPCTASTSARAPVSAAWVCTAKAHRIGDDVGPGPDVLGHPHVVVGEQRGGGRGDRRRAAVVHLEGVLRRAGEVRARSRRGTAGRADVSVDGLVVVADAEHVGGRARRPGGRAARGPA